MNRKDLIRHLEKNGCELLREGGKHSVFVNRSKKKISTVPRHSEINDFLAKKICLAHGAQYVNMRSCSRDSLTRTLGIANSASLPAISASVSPRAFADMPDM